MFMTNGGKLILVDPMSLDPDHSLTVLNEEGFVVGHPLMLSNEGNEDVIGPALITGDNNGHLYVVDHQCDKVKVLTYG